MSRESLQWLNTMTLIGFTDKRENAWHYREALQGNEPNHYPGPIPVEDVRRRLFAFTVEPRPLYVKTADLDRADLILAGQGFIVVPDRKAWATDDTETILGIFSDGYAGHQYDEWLTRNVESILDDELGIGSAGCLKNRAQAWVSVEVPDNVETPEGVTFRPQLIAATSFDGSIATVYKRSATIVVCDNTLSAGLTGAGEQFKLKHTRYSTLRIGEAREALSIVYRTADDLSAEIARLCAIDVPNTAWNDVLDIMVPLTDEKGEPIIGRSLTMREGKRDELYRLYQHDDRVAPWAGTAYGVLAAFNTYSQHYATVRGASQVQRNMSDAIGNGIAVSDDAVLAAIGKVVSV